MAVVKTSIKRSVELKTWSKFDAGELADMLADIPRGAELDVYQEQPVRGEHGSPMTRLTFTWEEDLR